MRNPAHPILAAVLAACATGGTSATRPATPEQYSTRVLTLPGATPDGIFMDYLAFDPRTGFVWAPAGNTGAVDVVDTASGKVSQIAGFPTAEMERRGRKRTVGPSSATIGDGVVYVGNRGDSTVCSFDARTLAKGACGHLESMPDGIAYVAATSEVWVTTPRDQSIRILDGKSLATKAKLTYEGEPEGFAVDAKRGRFYTNLEDKDRTLAIDLKSHAILATWMPNCGEDGPHGLALDEEAGYLFVACSTHAEVVNAGGDGAILSQIETGDGVDNLDYSPKWHELYVGAARAAKLTIARVEAGGKLALVIQVPTKEGARNGVVTSDGDVYLAASAASELVVAARTR